ncbi:unnamed protein product [Cylindrotheca closterium]|uniref:Uncharacterized protein n=1 Tax=Cylindrotheca closterium TaxID=2856 RepID=A0AAD2G9V3_9STRA|nr:unnamed protein product [Cylindrotheca closterium]
MKTAILLTLVAATQAFAPLSVSRAPTQLNVRLPEEKMTDDRKEILEIQKKWNEIRLLDREEASKTLDGEWLEAYNRFYEKYDDDMTRMTEIVEKLEKMIEPPKVAKKTKGQRKRDAYAAKLERSGHGNDSVN